MAKDGPTIIFDSNFVLNRESLLKFIDYCMQWARRLHATSGRISLKFTYGDDHSQRANFMWQGILFVQLIPSQVHIDDVPEQYCYCLLERNLDATHGHYYVMHRLWEDVFHPNLKGAIQQELSRLNQITEDIDAANLESPFENFAY